jgi:hypothetical protein
MRRLVTVTFTVGLVGGVLAASLAGAHGPPATLTADEVVERSVAARGGLDRWRQVGTMVWSGHIESARAPVPGMQFELEQKRPNKTRLQLTALGSRSVRVFDGAHGWKTRPGRGKAEAEPYSPQEWRSAQIGHGIDGPLLDHAARGNSVTLEGVDDLAGHSAYHLVVHLAKGGTEDVWVDTGTFLEVRYDRMADGQAGTPRRVSTLYGDYRTVEGLQLPFLISTGAGPGTTPDRMQIERVALNAPLDDAVFGNPAAPRSHRRSRPDTATAASEERDFVAP